MNMQGKLIVFEGVDGSGKSTQFELLTDRLESEGIPFRKIRFPRYSQSSASLLKSYLSGEFGHKPGDVNAYAASTFYFVDRFASFKTDWGEFYESGGLVICDRYTTSNAVHQGAKMPESELVTFLDWLYDFEFKFAELPRPNFVLYMDIDLKNCLKHMKTRQDRTGEEGDIHETDTKYLEKCLEVGKFASGRLGWKPVPCVRDGAMRTAAEIHEEIYEIVEKLL